MGLLENTFGAMLGHSSGQASSRPDSGSPYAPMVAALLGLLAAKAATGGFGQLGGLLGGGEQRSGTSPAETGNNPLRPGTPASPGGSMAAGGGLLDGLGGLIHHFQQSGHGGLVGSWVGSGENKPASPTEVTQALGPDTVDELARRTGMSAHDVASQLSQALPGVVNRLTPAGRLPTEDELPRSV